MKRMHPRSRRCVAGVHRHCRNAFTLVELLVVISIIGVLMGLLLPAIGAARETMRRTQCGTQLKNLALAATLHEGDKGELPSWCKKYGLFATGPDPSESDPTATNPPSHVKLGTWAVSLLPYLDAQPTYEHWTEDRYPILDGANGEREATSGRSGTGYHELAAPNLAIMQCPSNPNVNGNAGKNSYIGNCGMSHWRTAASTPMGSGMAGPIPSMIGSSAATERQALAKSMDKSNGVMINSYAGDRSGNSSFPVGQGVTLTDMKDGQGNTILFSENVQAMPWHRMGFINPTLASGTGLQVRITSSVPNPEVDYARSSRFAQGLVWHYEDDPSCAPGSTSDCQVFYPKHKINGGGATVSEDIFVEEMDVNNCIDLARPSSAHVDGVNCGMADGATRFVTESIDYRVYQALLTPRGKSSNVPWPEFVLTDEAF